MELSVQQQAELAFWRALVQEHGEYYRAFRASELKDKTKHFPSWPAQEGKGIDVGCGCVSVFECVQLRKQCLFGFDALADEYIRLLGEDMVDMTYVPLYNTVPDGDGSAWRLPDWVRNGRQSWAACLNMIDHMPENKIYWLLRDISETLKPGGILYFEVNLERGIAPPHYTVWNLHTPARVFSELQHVFTLKWYMVEDVPQHNQQRYWAEFVRV